MFPYFNLMLKSLHDLQWRWCAGDTKTWESSSLACPLASEDIHQWERRVNYQLGFYILPGLSICMKTCHAEHTNCKGAGVNRSSGYSCSNSQSCLFSFHRVNIDEQAALWNFIALLTLHFRMKQVLPEISELPLKQESPVPTSFRNPQFQQGPSVPCLLFCT